MGAGVAAGVSEFTGKAQYAFGDITKAAASRVSTGVAAGVRDFTGKERYAFGDVTRALLARLARRKPAEEQAPA